MIAAEIAGMHAHLSATVKGYAEKRRREMAKQIRPASRSGVANVAGWQQLASKFEQMGVPVQSGGDRLVIH